MKVFTKTLPVNASQEEGEKHYESLVVHINSGGVITEPVYKSLSFAHQYHFNRHINYRGDCITHLTQEESN